jgi:2-amino-4-hydroxy-6-hydroxymethyldihydropteridine diphosphokinase
LTKAFVALGANLEDPKSQVMQALAELDRLPASRVVARSSLYRTAPVGFAAQPAFINAVAQVETGLPARALMSALLELEDRHGRRRSVPNAPRTLDLDLLLYGDAIVREDNLVLPHPRMHERAFVLAPLAEIAADEIVPGRGRVADLLERVDRTGVELLDAA